MFGLFMFVLEFGCQPSRYMTQISLVMVITVEPETLVTALSSSAFHC